MRRHGRTTRHRLLARVLTAAVVLALSAAAPPSAFAEARPTPKIRKAQAVSKRAFGYIDKAHKLLEQQKYDEVIAILDEMGSSRRLNEHEHALMWQAYGYAYSSQENYPKAVEAFDKCLATNGLPQQAQLNTRYNVAQLYVMLERYDEAIPIFEQWFTEADNPSPAAYYMLALAYMQNGDLEKALPPAEQAVAKAEVPKEGWLGLLLSIHLTNKDYVKAIPVLEQAVSLYPKKTYWLQLAAAYAALGDNEKSLATYEMAYLQGYLTEDSELVNLAQLYLYNQLPLKAAQVLEKGLADGQVNENARTLELLADSWLHARERQRALAPLARAAKMSATGDVSVRLAQIYLEREEWSRARKALVAGIGKGQLKNTALAQLFLGIASVNEQRWDQAEQALRAAQEDAEYEKVATSWLANLTRERELAEQAAKAASVNGET